MKTPTKHYLAVAALALLTLAGCSSIPEKGSQAEALWLKEKATEKRTQEISKTLDSLPDWYAKPKCDVSTICAVASATSSDMQLSVDKAILDAKFAVADKLKGAITANMKSYVEESGVGSDPVVNQEVSKVISNVMTAVSLAGYELDQTSVIAERGKFRAFVSLRYPVGEANKIVVSETRKNAALESKMRASKAFAELEQQVTVQKVR
jgi:hypothetical protein